MSYHRFKDEDGEEFGSVEVFYAKAGQLGDLASFHEEIEDGTQSEAGWYWWACFPGCLPDSEPVGPFNTELEALEDAQNA